MECFTEKQGLINRASNLITSWDVCPEKQIKQVVIKFFQLQMIQFINLTKLVADMWHYIDHYTIHSLSILVQSSTHW